MEKEPLISIVVPVYNVEKYLDPCVDSIIEQTYSNWELLLIDDGSTDNSYEKCRGYREQYPDKIKVFKKENGGLSDARNYGCARAKGDYLIYIDSDDIVSRDYLSILFEGISKYGADVSTCMYKDIPRQDAKYLDQGQANLTLLSSEKSVEYLLLNEHVNTDAWGKLATREAWTACPFPKGRIYEDLATIYKLLASCDTVCYTDAELYGHVIRPGSLSRPPKISEKQCRDYFSGINERADYLLASNPKLAELIEVNRMIEYIRMYGNIFTRDTNSQYIKNTFKYIRSYIRKNCWKHLKPASPTFIFKLLTFALSSNLYLAMYKLYDKKKAVNG